MPRMSWPSWRRTHTVTRAAGEVKLMYGGEDAMEPVREERRPRRGAHVAGRLVKRGRVEAAPTRRARRDCGNGRGGDGRLGTSG
jgi:hypothetical protein